MAMGAGKYDDELTAAIAACKAKYPDVVGGDAHHHRTTGKQGL